MAGFNLLAKIGLQVVTALGTTLLSRALAKTPDGPAPDAPRPPRVEEGAPLPVVFGTVSLSPNCTAFQSYYDSGHTPWLYYVEAMLPLCHGPIDEIVEMVVDNGQKRLRELNLSHFPIVPAAGEYWKLCDFARDDVFGGESAGGHLRGHVYFVYGKPGQPALPAMAAKLTNGDAAKLPTYDQVVYVWLDRAEWGTSSQMRGVRFVVRRFPTSLMEAGGNLAQTGRSRIGSDANPAAMIYEACTNSRWAAQLAPAGVDLPSFLAAADTLSAEQLGASVAWEEASQTGRDFVADVLRHIYGSVQPDPLTGKLRLDLHRDTDEPILRLNATNARLLEAPRPAQHELVNDVRVRYSKRREAKPWGDKMPPSNAVTIAKAVDQASWLATGETRIGTYDFLLFQTERAAQQAAARVRRQVALPLARPRVATNRRAAGIKIGDVVALDFPEAGLVNARTRITGWDKGTLEENEIELSLWEDAFITDPRPPCTPVLLLSQADIFAAGTWRNIKDPAASPLSAPVEVDDVLGGIEGIDLSFGAKYDTSAPKYSTFNIDGDPATPEQPALYSEHGFILWDRTARIWTVYRTFTGLPPNKVLLVSGKVRTWSSTNDGSLMATYLYASGSLAANGIGADLDLRSTAGSSLGAYSPWTEATALGKSTPDGRLTVFFTVASRGWLQNYGGYLGDLAICDPSASEDTAPPVGTDPAVTAAAITEVHAADVRVRATIDDPDGAIAAGTATVRFQSRVSFLDPWEDVALYDGTQNTGVTVEALGPHLVLSALIPTGGELRQWRVAITRPNGGDGYDIVSAISGSYTPLVNDGDAGGGGSGEEPTGAVLASVIDADGTFVIDSDGNLVYAWIIP